MTAICAAVGFGDDLTCFALTWDSDGDGAGRTSGDTVRSKPMSGMGATGLFSCFNGRPAPGTGGSGAVAAGPEDATGGSISMVIGAGGATGLDFGAITGTATGAGVGAYTGGGILFALSSLRSRMSTDFARF